MGKKDNTKTMILKAMLTWPFTTFLHFWLGDGEKSQLRLLAPSWILKGFCLSVDFSFSSDEIMEGRPRIALMPVPTAIPRRPQAPSSMF